MGRRWIQPRGWTTRKRKQMREHIPAGVACSSLADAALCAPPPPPTPTPTPRSVQVRLRQLPDDVLYQVVARAPVDPAAAAGQGTPAVASGALAKAEAEAEADAAALRDYFNLSTSLAQLAPGWCSACKRYAAVHALLPGARMLRQDPVECLFQVGGGGSGVGVTGLGALGGGARSGGGDLKGRHEGRCIGGFGPKS